MKYEVFLQELRQAREKRGISLREMGFAMGVSAQKISLLETGYSPLKMRDYFMMCDIMKMSPRELIDGDIPKGEYRTVAEKLRNLSERDFRIVKDLIILMESSPDDL